MRIKVLYFAQLRELAPDGETVAIPEGATIADLHRIACERHPRLAAFGRAILYSRNQEWATQHEPLCDGDEVGIMPPVSGG